MPRRPSSMALAAAVALGAQACRDAPAPAEPAPTGRPTVASVTVAPTVDTLTVGDTVRLVATVMDSADKALTDRLVTWASSNSAVATVSTTGLVTGMRADGVGATITATSEDVSGTAAIAVTAPLKVTVAPLAAGGAHTCGLTSAGAAYCWGLNDYGQLGDGSTTDRSVPVAVSGSVTFTALYAGGRHTCGLTSSGAAHCWGLNYLGQLGDGSPTNRLVPVEVSGGGTFTALATGVRHTCGLTSAGAAYCWGDNWWGQLGNGSLSVSPIPVAVTGDVRFNGLAMGHNWRHTCAVTDAGVAYCWGSNSSGELGTGSRWDSPVPVAVSGGFSFSTLVTGAFHSCGLASGGAAYCWGDDHWGQLGDSSNTCETCESATPVAVYGELGFSALAAGGGHTCGLTERGVAYCWGANNSGQLGDGSIVNRSAPVGVSGGLSFRALAVGGGHTCALTDGGAAYCWGNNDDGQFGNGSTTGSTVPVMVGGEPGTAQAATGRRSAPRLTGVERRESPSHHGLRLGALKIPNAHRRD